MDLMSSDNPRLTLDFPIDIGYKCSWFAIKDADAEAITSLFGLKYSAAHNWQYGMAAAQAGELFITPSVGNWRLVIGKTLPFGDSETSRKTVEALLLRASLLAGEAQFFATHRVVEFHCWMKAKAGMLVRSYVYSGDHLEVIQNRGELTEGEPHDLITSQDIDALADEDKELSFPDEEMVMSVANAWSVNPNEISSGERARALGLAGIYSGH